MSALREFRADLHVHSCLSPCADIFMTPARIAKRAREAGLDMVTICDHNSAENAPYGKKACDRLEGLSFLPGLEITSVEEVHVVALFGGVAGALKMQRVVYDKLTKAPNDSAMYGDQIIVNEDDEVEGFNDRLLIGSVDMDLKSLVDQVHRLDGIAIAAHIDKTSFGVVGQLGFIPEDVDFDAVELSRYVTDRSEDWEREAQKNYFMGRRFPILFSSDAHRLEEVGKRRTMFLLKSPGFEEIRMALKEVGGRKVQARETTEV